MAIVVRSIGKTDIQVTSLGFGGAPLGAVGERISDDQASAIVTAALDGGIRFFDVAPLYGHGLSERRLGKVLGNTSREQFTLSGRARLSRTLS